MATIDMLVGQSVVLNAVPTVGDLDGNLVGVPTWVTANAALLGLTPSADGLSCKVTSKGVVGSTTVTCDALGSAPLTANHTINVVSAASALADAIALTVKGPPS